MTAIFARRTVFTILAAATGAGLTHAAAAQSRTPGFLHVLDALMIGFADFVGNGQYCLVPAFDGLD